MDFEALGEYIKEKAWLIGIALALVGIVVSINPAHGLVWSSAAVAIGFIVIWSIYSMRRSWRMFTGGERYVQTGLHIIMLAMLVWILSTGLLGDGPKQTFQNWGLAGIDFVLFLGFALIVSVVPRWARDRKKCPDCHTATDVAAKACSCGYRWPEDQPDAGGTQLELR